MSFAAYITSFFPLDNQELRDSRSAVVRRQIEWWLEKTSVDIYVTAMNYEESDKVVDTSGRLHYIPNPPMKANPARKVAFERFYASDYDFGIMMDDDAILYDKPHHNSGPNLFAEMDTQIAQYSLVDVFFPINPQKVGFNPIWDKATTENLHKDNHVFKRSMDLKGSMFVVRNFRKYGKTEVYPDPTFNWQDDTKFAIEAVAAGHSVTQCENIILHELSGTASHFAADPTSRIPFMREGNERIAQEFAHKGLKMKTDSHLLDRKDFMKECWAHSSTKFVIPREGSQVTNLFDFG